MLDSLLADLDAASVELEAAELPSLARSAQLAKSFIVAERRGRRYEQIAQAGLTLRTALGGSLREDPRA